MTLEQYDLAKLTVGVIASIGLYSVLYRENKFYRFFEHVFVGFASGWTLVTVWTETLGQLWWDKMIGHVEDGKITQMGYWPYAILLPLGMMGYFVFSKKHNWLSRIPIGIILGLYSGQQIQVWWNQYGPQIANSVKPVIPTTFSSMTIPSFKGLPPEQIAQIKTETYPSQALSNIIFTITLLSVMSYFLFSFKLENNKAMNGISKLGRWLLMIGFGAMFGSTVMMRFTLLIDRMYFIFIEWLQKGLLHR